MKKHINLLDYRKRIYSRIGNDGIVKFILDTLGIEKGIFVEFGAWDGIWNSNCRGLFEKGWEGIFIEPHDKRYKKMKKTYRDKDRITCIRSKIKCQGDQTFDNIVDPYLKGKQIDFCSIDIDGLDLEIFETFKKYLPTVVCIEGGQVLHPFHKRVSKDISCKDIGQSLSVSVNSFEKRGYKILCSYQDCFFVKKEFYNYFNVSDDILILYFNGLRARPLSIASLQRHLTKVALKNGIADYILSKSKYNTCYGWKKRKEWVNIEISNILKYINKAEVNERKKYEKNNVSDRN